MHLKLRRKRRRNPLHDVAKTLEYLRNLLDTLILTLKRHKNAWNAKAGC
jgi:hypothetical protein